MSLEYTTKYIVEWPAEMTRSRSSSPFKAAYNDTLELLDRELRHLSAKNVIMQLAYDEGDIRVDGRPRASAKMQHPGVIITFNSKFGPLSYFTDEYTDWQANVRAIALALQALRAVDRYGVNKRGTQYQGYKRLDAAAPSGNGFASVEDAASFIAEYCVDLSANQIAGNEHAFNIAYTRSPRKRLTLTRKAATRKPSRSYRRPRRCCGRGSGYERSALWAATLLSEEHRGFSVDFNRRYKSVRFVASGKEVLSGPGKLEGRIIERGLEVHSGPDREGMSEHAEQVCYLPLAGALGAAAPGARALVRSS